MRLVFEPFRLSLTSMPSIGRLGGLSAKPGKVGYQKMPVSEWMRQAPHKTPAGSKQTEAAIMELCNQA